MIGAEKSGADDFASVIIVIHNQVNYLNACITSILMQDFPHEIIVVDNQSTDTGPDLIEENYPQVTLVRNPINSGYGAGNNLGVSYAHGRYIVIMNPDVITEEGWLRNLIDPLKNSEKTITTPKILLYDGSKINTCGTIIHFTGLCFTRGLYHDTGDFHEIEEVGGISGACFALKKVDYIALGGFDPSFFLYNEDTDFSWRAHIEEYRILFIPQSVIRHDYRLSISPEKLYFLEKGRYIILKKYYSRSQLFLIAPSLIATELMIIGYSFSCGRRGFILKIKAMFSMLDHPAKYHHGVNDYLISRLTTRIPDHIVPMKKGEIIMISLMNRIFAQNFRFLIKKPRWEDENRVNP